jgi:hypothetical protein
MLMPTTRAASQTTDVRKRQLQTVTHADTAPAAAAGGLASAILSSAYELVGETFTHGLRCRRPAAGVGVSDRCHGEEDGKSSGVSDSVWVRAAAVEEWCVSLVLGAISAGWSPSCGVTAGLTGATCVSHLAYVAVLRPYESAVDNGFSIAVAFGQVVCAVPAVALATMALRTGSTGDSIKFWIDVAGVASICLSGLVVLQAAVALATEAWAAIRRSQSPGVQEEHGRTKGAGRYDDEAHIPAASAGSMQSTDDRDALLLLPPAVGAMNPLLLRGVSAVPQQWKDQK